MKETSSAKKGVRSITLIAAGLIAGGVLAGTLSAGAQTGTPASTVSTTDGATSTAATSTPATGETALTGTTADKVKAAALAAVPGGTIIRVETDSAGSPYEAHMTKTDGSEVTVKIDSNFKVTSIDAGGGRHGGGAGETALTGTTADKVKAAALAAVPGGTIIRVETDRDGSPYEAHVRKSDGTEVTVKVDKDFRVTTIDTHGGRRTSSGSSSPTSTSGTSA